MIFIPLIPAGAREILRDSKGRHRSLHRESTNSMFNGPATRFSPGCREARIELSWREWGTNMSASSRPAEVLLRIAVVLALGFVAALASSPAMAFAARFSWSGIPTCSNVSPPFAISGAPKGTTALRFAMHDLDAPGFEHGGSTAPFSGSGSVPRGAIQYIGPCPPGSERHRYVWTIEALGKNGEVLASSMVQGKFPPQ